MAGLQHKFHAKCTFNKGHLGHSPISNPRLTPFAVMDILRQQSPGQGLSGSAGALDRLLYGIGGVRSGQLVDKDALCRCPLLSSYDWAALVVTQAHVKNLPVTMVLCSRSPASPLQ